MPIRLDKIEQVPTMDVELTRDRGVVPQHTVERLVDDRPPCF